MADPTPLPKELSYIQDAYQESFDFLRARKERQVRQLVLLNNLQRGDQNIASTLLLTLFNRLLSSLYDDKKQIKFLPSQGITQEQLNSYNILAESDYLEMGKSKLDYDWVWDTLFFGRGYMETLKFNKKRKIMEPQVINPLVFGYDPYNENVQDWRYYWKWISKSKHELKRLIKNGTITGISKPEQIGSGLDPYLWNYKILRDKAKAAIEPAIETAAGDIYQILEFYGYDDEGNKCVYWTDRSMAKVLWKEKLDFEDLDYGDQDKKGSKWPVVIKEAMREPHSSVTFSIADLLEDKHRAKSVLLNLAYIAAKDKANPLYWYDPDKIRDVTQFFSRQIDQHIPVTGNGVDAVGPLNTQEPLTPELTNFISMLQQEANAPIGTGVTLQPQKNKTSNTATEAAIDQQLNDMAQSLQSKVMQFGEAEFWSHWFHRYAKHADELKEKMANIVGVKGISSQMVNLDDFNTDFPPGVLVYSAKEAEYKNQVKQSKFIELYPNLMQSMDPDGFRNFNKHVFMPLMLEDPSLIDIMFPETMDEMNAKAENEQLMRNEMMDAQPTDNQTTHIYTHMMVQPKTWAVWFHVEQHKQLLAQQIAQQQQAEAQAQQEQAAKTTGATQGPEKQSPMAQASPLAVETKSNLQSNIQK